MRYRQVLGRMIGFERGFQFPREIDVLAQVTDEDAVLERRTFGYRNHHYSFLMEKLLYKEGIAQNTKSRLVWRLLGSPPARAHPPFSP